MATDITPTSFMLVSPMISNNNRAQAAIQAAQQQRNNVTQATCLAGSQEAEEESKVLASASMISRIDNTPLLLRSADDRHVGRIDSLPANENNISAGN